SRGSYKEKSPPPRRSGRTFFGNRLRPIFSHDFIELCGESTWPPPAHIVPHAGRGGSWTHIHALARRGRSSISCPDPRRGADFPIMRARRLPPRREVDHGKISVATGR